MSKPIKKPRPSVPKWYWTDTDGCWDCPKNKRYKACNGCKMLKKFLHRKDKAKRRRYKQLLRAKGECYVS